MKAITRLGRCATDGNRKGPFKYARMAGVAVALATILLTAHAQAGGYSMQITFTNLPGGVTLTNFPALVKLDSSNTDNYTGFLDTSNGWDLRFWTNSALTGTELDYEIEAFDTSTNSYVWVKVPELTQDTSIWASWGDAANSSQEAYTTNGAVWSEGFEGVFHLSESVTDEQTSGSYDDSSPNDNAGAQNNTGVGDGLIGSCGDFDGNDYIIVANESDYDFKDKITAAMWIRTEGGWDKSWQMFMTKGADKHWDLRRYSNTEQVEFITDNDNTGCVGPATNIANDEWRYFVGVYDQADGKGRAYIDGQLYHVDTSADTDLTLNNEPLQISGRQGANFCHKGLIDEVRVSNAVRSSNWVWACYMNQGTDHESFVEYGGVSALSGVVVDITNGNATVTVTTYDIGGTNDATVVGTMSWTNALTGSNASFDADSPWTISGIDLAVGANVITVSGTNSAGDVGSDSVTIVRVGPPSVDNAGGATGIDIGVATLQGRVTATNGASLDAVRIYFGDNDGGATHSWDTNYTFDAGTIFEGATFTTNLTGLYYGVVYSHRVYASNEYGEVWSAVTNFTTLQPQEEGVVGVALQTGTTDNPGAASGVDLLQTSLSSASPATWNQEEGYGTAIGVLSDASSGDYSLGSQSSLTPHSDDDVTFTLDSVSSPGGYTITQIDFYHGWKDDGRDRMQFQIEFSLVGDSGFVTYGTTTLYDPPANKGRTEATDSSGTLATGVDQIRVTVQNIQNGYGGLSEIDVFGTAVPDVVAITNTFATNITASTADLQGTLDGTGSVFEVYAYWSTSNNTGSAEWLADTTASNAFVATYTNAVGLSLNASVSDLTRGETYYYTFMASNAVTNIWATPNAEFTTDGTAPEPDLMTWAVAPAAMDTSRVKMTATTAIDALNNPCQYYFQNTNTSETSGWISGTVWTNTGLTSGTTYGYRVKARDAVSNETAWSVVETATPAGDTQAPTPNPLTWALAPTGLLDNAIVMTATAAADPNGPIEYYFENLTNGNNSGWITSTTWTNTDLTMGSNYGYRVQAKDNIGNTGQWSTTLTAVAEAPLITLFYEGFEDPVIDGEVGTPPTGWESVTGSDAGLNDAAVTGKTGDQFGWVFRNGGTLQITNLTDTLEAGISYTLTCDLTFERNDRADIYGSLALMAGTNVIAATTNAAASSKNFTVQDISLSFQALSDNPYIGEPLGIRLSGNYWRPYFDELYLYATDTAGDTTAPTPGTMTWNALPTSSVSNSITMQATTASDANGVQYFFTNTVNGNVSGWQESPIWSDTGLTPETTYSYKFKARDKSANTNETSWSTEESALCEQYIILYESFEEPSILPDTVKNFGTYPMPPVGWTYSANSLDVWNEAGITLSTPFGQQFVAMRAGKGNEIMAALSGHSLEAGTTYRARFSAGGMDSVAGGAKPATTQIELIAGSTVVALQPISTTTADLSETCELEFIPNAAHANLDEPLTIRLETTATPSHWNDRGMIDNIKVYAIPDTAPPTPGPSFAVEPFGINATSIVMTAAAATDLNGPVEYLFTNATLGVTSGWRTNTFWHNTGLTDGNSYDYQVRTRDAIDNQSAWSAVSTASATNETTAPTPDPASFAVAPVAVDSTTIAMTANPVSDTWNNPCQYNFYNVSNITSSGWSTNTSWSETGLTPGQTYGYQVQARDAVSNETARSSVLTATPEGDSTPPNPDPMGFSVLPAAIDPYTISMTASNATDFSEPVQYYFLNTSNNVNSGWISSRVWTNGSLTPGNVYGYQVMARDAYSNETAYSEIFTAAAVAPAATIFSDSFENPPHADVSGLTIAIGDSQGWVASGTAGLLDEGSTYFTASDGSQAAALGSSGAYITSTNLTATLQASVQYDLSFNVASKFGASAGYRVNLLAGGTTLNSLAGTVASDDTSANSNTISFTAAPNNPIVGQTLAIELINTSGEVYFDSVLLTTTHTGGDSTAPTPDPLTWNWEPQAVANNSIGMSANLASDPRWVQYFFTNTVNGNTSGWQEEYWWTDTELIHGTNYIYMVKARDNSVNLNETAWSTPTGAVCNANVLLYESFEDPVIDGSVTDLPTGWTQAGGWNKLNDAPITGKTGDQFGMVHGIGDDYAMTTTSAILSSNLTYGYRYTLTCDATWDDNRSGTAVMRLLAGASVVDTVLGPVSTAYDFSKLTLTMDFTPASDHPNLDQPLSIALSRTNGWGNSKACFDNLTLTATPLPDDTTSPSPSNMVWVALPTSSVSNSITMQATNAVDVYSVQYFFTNTANGNVSGWQDSQIWTDTDLTPGETYSYRVKARDTSPASNETGWSPEESAECEEHIILYESFETPSILPSTFLNFGTYPLPVEGWTGSGHSYVNHDNDATYPDTPFGMQYAYLRPDIAYNLTATLAGHVLETKHTYRVTSYVGSDRYGVAQSTRSTHIELIAGSTVVASNSVLLTSNDFSETHTLEFSVQSSHPNVGEALKVRIYGSPNDNHIKVMFDNIKVYAIPIPPSGSLFKFR